MQVSEIMHEGVKIAQVTDSVQTVAQLMRDNDIGSVPLYDQGKPVGFVTDRDIVVSCVADGASFGETIRGAMSSELFCINQDQDVQDAAKMMKEKQVSRILVVGEEQEPVGMVTLQDLSQKFQNQELNAEVLTEIKQ